VQHDQLERRRCERPIGLDAIARDQREAETEQQVDERDDRNAAKLHQDHHDRRSSAGV
jgi:hypothetical protein